MSAVFVDEFHLSEYHAERDDLPCNYGLVNPPRSNNPVVIAFHEWTALGRDLWRSPTWRARFACLIGRPGDGASVYMAAPSTRDAGQRVDAAKG